MAATDELAQHFIKTFEATAIHLVQQKLSKFRSRVTEKNPGPTEKHSFRTVAARGAMTDRTNLGLVAGKRPATNYADTVFHERVAVSTPKNTADSFSKPDMRRMLENPQSEIYKAMLPQVGRTFDDVIVAAFHAAALDTAGNSTAFGATGTTPTLGGAGQAWSWDLLAACLQAYNTDDVDEDEEKFIAVPPAVVTAILNDPKATSVDFVNAKALQSGKLQDSWMGFTWLMSNRLNHPVAGDTYIQAWTRDALGLLVLGDVAFEYGKNPAAQFDTTIQLDIDIGAVRIQEEKAKRIRITE
jgi:hypothetical protein